MLKDCELTTDKRMDYSIIYFENVDKIQQLVR